MLCEEARVVFCVQELAVSLIAGYLVLQNDGRPAAPVATGNMFLHR